MGDRANTKCPLRLLRRSLPTSIANRYEPVAIRIEKDGRWALADKPPLATSAAEVIEQSRVEAARQIRTGREVHLVSRPSEETILSIKRAPEASPEPTEASVTGLHLDVIFPVLHGPYGEDGTIQGLLELANVPYVGAGVAASALGMDKALMKVLFSARGLPVCDYQVVLRRDWERQSVAIAAELERRLRFPMFVKPANLGSSVGISKAKNPASLREAMDLAGSFDRKIIVEAAVPNAREIECGVLGNDEPQTSVPGEVIPSREFYDYEAKYLDEGSKTVIPADLPAAGGRRDPAVVGCRVSGDRLRRDGARRFSALPGQRCHRPQRSQYDPRLHHDQHVLEDVGGVRRQLPNAHRSTRRAGARTPRRKTALTHQPSMIQ